MLTVFSGYERSEKFFLVPRPHYSARTKRFGSRGPSVNTSPKGIDREGLGKRRTGTRQEEIILRQPQGFLRIVNSRHFYPERVVYIGLIFLPKVTTKMEIKEKLLFRAKEVTLL